MSGIGQTWHWIVLAVIVLLLFGAKRLPDAARSLGRSMRILKAETKGLRDDDVRGKAEAQAAHEPLEGTIVPPPPAQPTPPPAPQPDQAAQRPHTP